MQLINDLGKQFADALREGQIAIVPKIALGTDGGNALSTLAQLANAFMAEKLDAGATENWQSWINEQPKHE